MTIHATLKKILCSALTPLITIVVIFVVGYLVIKYSGNTDPVVYSASLEEFEWPEGPGLIHMRTASNSNEVGINPGNYIMSTDGKVSAYLQATSYEALSPTELLISGRTNVYDVSKKIETPFYYITTSEVRTIETVDNQLFEISLAPSKKYLKYTIDNKLCIAEFDFVTLGECYDAKTLIPVTWDWNTYFIDGEWDKVANKYVMRIRNSKEHDEVASRRENAPPERIQKEVARYQYDAEKNIMKILPLDSEIQLKTKGSFMTVGDPKGNITQQGYKMVYDQGGNTIGLEQLSTGKKAKLMDAPFFGEMSGFDLY